MNGTTENDSGRISAQSPRVFHATHPGTGEKTDAYSVHTTESGMHIVITDVDTGGHVLWLHRFAWEPMVEAMKAMFEEEAREAIEHNRFNDLYHGED